MGIAENWQRLAACHHEDANIFFPTITDRRIVADQVQAAKAICGRCIVRASCLQYAIENNERYGIWGGTTPRQRRGLRRTYRYNQKIASNPYEENEEALDDQEICL